LLLAWALRVSCARPVLGPNEQRVLESLVGVLRTTNQEPARETEVASGITEGDWWRTTSAALQESVPDFPDRFPNTTWLLSQQPDLLASDHGYVEQQSMVNLRMGLGILLDGVEAAESAQAGSVTVVGYSPDWA
jgi:hypothetical protein